ESEFQCLQPTEQLILWCATQALRDAGLWEQRAGARLGLVLGLGAEWLLTWEKDMHKGGRRVHDARGDVESHLAVKRRALGLAGPAVTVAAACASGNYALAQARRWIALGVVDVCLAGACNRDVTPLALACFGNLGALSQRNAAPAAASRPFD